MILLLGGYKLVDFGKLLGREGLVRAVDPIVIFDNLDKESSKEYLWPAQKSVLKEWHEKLRVQKDTIVKLHTGQGKTLIGLLMLQSSINEGRGPAVYICPNNYLVAQTVEQARSFGIKTVTFEEGSTKPPKSFLNSEAVLITNCNKLFNGKSVFGVAGSGKESIQLGAIVMDDAHKCIDIIRESFSITVKRLNPDETNNPLYAELQALFEETLKRQAPGTYVDIRHGEECFMSVPFWTWYDRKKEVIDVLQKYKENQELLFVWDLLKNRIEQCTCILSGKELEIAPRLLPIELIPSFVNAERRVFLSATLTDDAFLVRDLGIAPESVLDPLSSGDVKYSGERLILIPTLVNTSLKREKTISWLSQLAKRYGDFGIVAIVPSFRNARDWGSAGAETTDVKRLYRCIDELKEKVKQKNAKNILVLVNEYDGVDLPDNTCRILCLDSLPSYSSLFDKYTQDMRLDSKIIRQQLAQRIEQGMGRAIRGSSDWCIVMITGTSLTDFLSENAKRAYLSNEAQIQIKIGQELASEMQTEGKQLSAMEDLICQCLNRDEGWKEYYKNRMAKVDTKKPNNEHLSRAVLERKAETLYRQNLFEKALECIQELVASSDSRDKGWYLQLMAIYKYPVNPSKSMDLQLKAHSENDRLFRPEVGVSYSKLSPINTNRTSLILEWIRKHESHNSLCVDVANILDKVTFNSASDLFEEGIDQLGILLGFATQRPEKVSGSGPDNLWHIESKNYWLIECKNMVAAGREGISKSEIGQLSNSIGWFKENYKGCLGTPVLVHPSKVLEKDAYIAEPFWTLQPDALEGLRDCVKNFYNSLKELSFDAIYDDIIKNKLKEYRLEIDDLKSLYISRVKEHVMTKK